MIGGIASGESMRRKPCGWDETVDGAAQERRLRLKSVVPVAYLGAMPFDLICRTAVYVIRSHGGVGGGSRKAFPYPD